MTLKRMLFMLTTVLGWIGSIALFFAALIVGMIEGWPMLGVLFIMGVSIYAFAIFTWYLNREFKKQKEQN